MSEVRAATTMVTDGELPKQVARAEVARLSLAIRAARRAAELAEREAADLDRLTSDAEALLDASLKDLLEARRSACAQELAEERVLADRVVADAREEAARSAALPTEAEAPADDPLVAADRIGGAALNPTAHSASLDPALTSDMALLSADELRELVRASVFVGLREAMEQAAAMVHLAPSLAQLAPAARPAREPADADILDEAPFWGRFLHVDVMLPLVAALIVVVLFVAWVG